MKMTATAPMRLTQRGVTPPPPLDAGAVTAGRSSASSTKSPGVQAACNLLLAAAQVRNIAEVTTAVARGDLSRKITVDAKGEILELKKTINTMVDQLNAFASEVTRVAREVGTEGKLGGQAQVPGVAGTWKDLTDTVNVMAVNLTEQVRGIVKVVTAVADGDLSQNLTVKAKGEVAALADTINAMTGTLATFADQVTTVAREVGVEGRLGGQANVPGAAGTWKDLTGNVNLLADNLTNQVRAIAEVATAVTKGDLTRSVQVDARGEVAELKDYARIPGRGGRPSRTPPTRPPRPSRAQAPGLRAAGRHADDLDAGRPWTGSSRACRFVPSPETSTPTRNGSGTPLPRRLEHRIGPGGGRHRPLLDQLVDARQDVLPGACARRSHRQAARRRSCAGSSWSARRAGSPRRWSAPPRARPPGPPR